MKGWWLAVALCVAGSVRTQAQSADSRDEGLIKAQLTAYAEASERGDGHSRASFYTEDAEVWLSTTRTLSRGRATIEIGLCCEDNEFERIQRSGARKVTAVDRTGPRAHPFGVLIVRSLLTIALLTNSGAKGS
jgi:hypothetical protein